MNQMTPTTRPPSGALGHALKTLINSKRGDNSKPVNLVHIKSVASFAPQVDEWLVSEREDGLLVAAARTFDGRGHSVTGDDGEPVLWKSFPEVVEFLRGHMPANTPISIQLNQAKPQHDR